MMDTYSYVDHSTTVDERTQWSEDSPNYYPHHSRSADSYGTVVDVPRDSYASYAPVERSYRRGSYSPYSDSVYSGSNYGNSPYLSARPSPFQGRSPYQGPFLSEEPSRSPPPLSLETQPESWPGYVTAAELGSASSSDASLSPPTDSNCENGVNPSEILLPAYPGERSASPEEYRKPATNKRKRHVKADVSDPVSDRYNSPDSANSVSSEYEDDGGSDDNDSDYAPEKRTRRSRPSTDDDGVFLDDSMQQSRGRKVPVATETSVEYADAISMPSIPFGVKKAGGPNMGRRRYMCTYDGCGKTFVRGEHLKRHVRSLHLQEKPHECPFSGCTKSFSRKDNLKQHMGIFHSK